MGTNRWCPRRGVVAFALSVTLGAAGAAAAQSPGNGAPTLEPGQQAVAATGAANPVHSEIASDSSTVLLPCIPVGTYWSGPPPSEEMPPGPDLAVVAIDVRPKDAEVFLDDRFVSRARYLDGKPDYLYLEPGRYKLELRLSGYQTIAIDLDAAAGGRFDLKHRLDRAKGKAEDQPQDANGKGKPFQRVYSPLAVEGALIPPAKPARGAPNPSLRPDLGSDNAVGVAVPEKRSASLRIRVSPEQASVLLDGVFVATGRELNRMEGPLATSAGTHTIEVRADGYATLSRSVELEPGEAREVTIDLSAIGTN
jgi:hypothetical protein